jgi:outer membrane protein OmpA-like peptidoglycan-associated protein
MLVKLGINASRLESKGFGESNPVSENSSPEGKANNRRVEFIKI